MDLHFAVSGTDLVLLSSPHLVKFKLQCCHFLSYFGAPHSSSPPDLFLDLGGAGSSHQAPPPAAAPGTRPPPRCVGAAGRQDPRSPGLRGSAWCLEFLTQSPTHVLHVRHLHPTASFPHLPRGKQLGRLPLRPKSRDGDGDGDPRHLQLRGPVSAESPHPSGPRRLPLRSLSGCLRPPYREGFSLVPDVRSAEGNQSLHM